MRVKVEKRRGGQKRQGLQLLLQVDGAAAGRQERKGRQSRQPESEGLVDDDDDDATVFKRGGRSGDGWRLFFVRVCVVRDARQRNVGEREDGAIRGEGRTAQGSMGGP